MVDLKPFKLNKRVKEDIPWLDHDDNRVLLNTQITGEFSAASGVKKIYGILGYEKVSSF